jgi:uncharacterized membrane protein
MENLIKDIEAIEYDMLVLINRAEGYRQDADRGVNVNHTAKEEGYSNEKVVESLFEYLTDAVHDIDRMRDDMKEIMEHLTNLVDNVEYESVRQQAVKD